MNRRGHLSTKIPQVKLRPAPAPNNGAGGGSSSARGGKNREASPLNMMDEEIMRRALADAEDEETSTAALRRNSRPWKGIVITFTGVENKPQLTALAKELGAGVESALTVNVTHVVASGFGSAKYLYAVEHRLPTMMPSWIEDAHAQWLNGDELDNAADVEDHRLLPFTDLRIAMSGVEPLERRKQLIKYITANGGQYNKDLDRTCTHLISAKPTSEPRSSEKVKWALREIADLEARKRRGVRTDEEEMKIVYEEWIWDCVAYQGRWKEDYYDARKARRGGRVQADDVLNGTLGFNQVAEKKPPVDALSGGGDAVDNNEPAVMRKRKREGIDNLVNELVSTTGTGSKPENRRQEDCSTSSDRASKKPDTTTNGKPSLLHVSRSTSFANASNGGPSKPLPIPSATERTSSIPGTAQPPPGVIPGEQVGAKKFFEGLKFSHVIAEQCNALEDALRVHGGTVVSDEERRQGDRVDYIIVRLCSDIRPTLTAQDEGTVVITECWVEGCCFEERLLSPDKHIVFRPLPAPMPISGASNLIVHLSGFSAENNVYMRRLLRAIGGTLSIKLNKQTTHLVSVLNSGQKVEKAREWGVKVMKESWLIAMARSGAIEQEDGHRWLPGFAATGPTHAGLTRRLGQTADLTANMSTMSELPDAADYARRPAASSFTSTTNHPKPDASQLGVTVSPSRMLKPSPTHIGDGSTSSIGGGGGGSRTTTTTSILRENVLSPPKAETQRLLNSADPGLSLADPETKDKIARYASAPANANTARAQSELTAPPVPILSSGEGLEKAASMSSLALPAGPGTGADPSVGASLGLGSSSKGKEMTEVLRQLAEKETAAPGSTKGRVVRRSRPSARIKNNSTRSPMHSLSPAASRYSLSPIKPSDTASASRFQSHQPSPAPDDELGEGTSAVASGTGVDGAGAGAGVGVGEESVQVKYVDAASARERKKIMAMFEEPSVGDGREGKRRKR
ncbi:hypothetical protein I316_02947 [Kwoniella heveanensis BCC8398]|uniref:BRCT domain-containing protein n=1 Tax=Kwoniella heveanensis BCC8398 TaxID=1296120 RepID=A0A1B9GWI3_9TREE|nr:hypothetical protein I316_02947 [Kwoniella heveanensis BCC8398]